MASLSPAPRAPSETPDETIRRLTTELHEAYDQQAAVTEILDVINRSPGNLTPVFEAILDKAMALCEAAHGSMQLYDGQQFRAVAVRGLPEPLGDLLRGGIRPSPEAPMWGLLKGDRFVHVPDLTKLDIPEVRFAVEHGSRTTLHIPLRKGDVFLGQIVAVRREVQPFSDKHIALLENFAAQAVIAMENARLLTETREALEQQTATAEVLQVINSSPGDLAPVFDAILEKATRLCEAPFGLLRTWDGKQFHLIAAQGDPKFTDWAWNYGPWTPAGDSSPAGRIVRGEDVVCFADAPGDEAISISPGFSALVEASGMRSGVTVALRKDDILRGTVTVFRREVRPFTEQQIALLRNFAAQAVIAIENARLLTETREALAQQTATAEVLQVINSSPGELVPVFDAILEKAHSLCGADHGSLTVRDGDMFRAVATYAYSAAWAERLREGLPVADDPVVEALLDGAGFVQFPDLAEIDHPVARASADATGVRTALFVPLRKDGVLLGTISAVRREVRPFTDKQIALLQNFAAQAVIAMENARLLTETRDALKQQTATAEVLGVINSSPGDLTPVFDAMLEKATRLCGAPFGILRTWDGERTHLAAVQGDHEFTEWARERGPFIPHSSQPIARITSGENIVPIADALDSEAYRTSPGFRELVDRRGIRSLITVALRKDTALLGTVTVYRQEVRPFSDKEIALLQNFAAQAVIAMENARLLTETREALEQQTATAEVLQVINSSPGDLAPVFDAILEKAHTLCGAAHGALATYDGEYFRAVALNAMPEPFGELLRQPFQSSAGGSAQRRLLRGERLIHIPDVTAIEPTTPIQRASIDAGSAPC